MKALIITLGILGSSSVAMARPVISYSAEASLTFGTRTSGPVVRDHRWTQTTPTRWNTGYWNERRDRDYYQPRVEVLGEGLSFGDTQYRKDIVVGSHLGNFRALQLNSNGGSTYIMKVVIEFADGGVQRIDINRTLRGYQGLTLDLDGNRRPLHRILIYRADGGEALHMNRRHYGEFNVTAL